MTALCEDNGTKLNADGRYQTDASQRKWSF